MIALPFAFADSVHLDWNPRYWIMAVLIGLALWVWRADKLGHLSKFKWWLGLAAFLAAIGVELSTGPWDLNRLLISSMMWVGILGCLGFVSFRQPIFAALSFAVTVIASCVIFLFSDAPFIAAGTMIVYAGATIIIFLFVLMFAQQSKLQHVDLTMSFPKLSILGGMFLLGLLWCAIPLMPMGPPVEVPPSKVSDLGRIMYTDYLWTVEIAGTLLLIATLGAVVIATDTSWAESSPNLQEATRGRKLRDASKVPNGGESR